MKKNSLPAARQGFTLIEMIVVTMIIGLLMVTVSAVFFATLRGSVKNQHLTEVKQNGNYALSVMERMLRNARGIQDCTAGMHDLTLTNPDGEVTTFTFGADKIASNSSDLTTSRVIVSNGRFDCLATLGQPDRVQIVFSVSQSSTSVRPEEQATANFQTTVTLRNY